MFNRSRKAAKRTANRTFHYVKDDVLNAQEIKGHYQDAKEVVKEQMNPWRRKAGRQETFANAVERMKLSPEDIAAAYKNHSFRFYGFSFFTGLAFFLGAWAAIQGQWLGTLAGFGAVLACSAQMFSASFRCFQIRHHELFSVREWWHAKGEWLPGDYTPPRSQSRALRK